MRYIFYGMIALLIAIQYPLWLGKGGLLHVYQMDKEVEEQQKLNRDLENRNNKLAGDVNDLRQGTRAVEERARIEHGMVKDNETMIQIVQSDEELPKSTTRPKVEKKVDGQKSSGVAKEVSAVKETSAANLKPKSTVAPDKASAAEKVLQ